ncbi:hypothetical protein L596_022790 [Steinernema carpocapsae]|uniref:Uncharacterized protein n=1 Tax=Steinernema carpocapsae TaxID=34508 RepID=A0A4U5MMR3_STECR|nr:hypothetical protein L596_022790 [Steinernema carpocapsae]
MFAKPNRMSGCAGVSKISNVEELEDWLFERSIDSVPVDHVIQKFITGEEFGITLVLLRNGTWKPLNVHFLAGTTYYEAVLKGGI